MYHDTAAPPADAPFPELHVSTQDFRAQMRWLAEHGYRAVTMAQVLDAWEGDGLLPRRPAVVSFDDGFRSHHSKALPILSELGWPGVLNLQVHSEKGLPDDAALSPEMVEEMIAAGWELASHTISHADLTTVDDAQLESEVVGSRKALQRQFDVPVDHFCYPAGKYDDAVVEAVERAGYSSAATVDDGVASSDEPYTLERIRINGSDGVEGFAEKIEAAET
jgi:peptidoglycan/xylan/chitin deacetylase (PgdA/CDA1 family)